LQLTIHATSLNNQQNNKQPPVNKPSNLVPAQPDPPPPPGFTNAITEAPIGSGWSEMAKNVNEVDKQKIHNCKEDIDTFLVFVRVSSVL
jgi:hypothetical protein